MIKLNEIYNRDSIGFIKELKVDYINPDIIVTSPPYNIGINYGDYYNDNLPIDKYLNWIEQVAKQSWYVLKDDGSFFLNVGFTSKNPLLPFDIAKRFEHVNYILQNSLIWLKAISVDKDDIGKNNGSLSENVSVGHFKPINSPCYLSNLYEYIFHFTKSGNVKLNKLGIGVPYQDKTNINRRKSKKSDCRDRGNVLFMPYETIQERRPHPAVFPIKLPKQCIKLHGYNRDTIVYDPFIGTGTTALACIDLGVKYLGTEINEEFFHIANSAIKDKLSECKNEILGIKDNTKYSQVLPSYDDEYNNLKQPMRNDRF